MIRRVKLNHYPSQLLTQKVITLIEFWDLLTHGNNLDLKEILNRKKLKQSWLISIN